MPRRNPIANAGGVRLQPAGRYRFWGNTRPPESREPIRAMVSSNDDGAGTATIRLYDPIDSWGGYWGVSSSEFAEALDALDSSVTDIHLRLNSPGGEVHEGIAILNLLRQHDANVTAFVDGWAASAASFIACGVDEVVMGENSQLMIHDAWGICVGAAVDMHSMGDLLDKISSNIAAVYQSKAGETVDFWRSAMLAETWYDAQEAVDAGLADRLASDTEDDPDAEAPEDKFDASIFKNQGRQDAPPPPIPAEPKAEGITAKQRARHRMNARRHAQSL